MRVAVVIQIHNNPATMTDLTTVLPAFQINGRLLTALEKSSVTTADLISLDPADIAKRTQLAVNVPDVKGLSDAVLEALQDDLKPKKGIPSSGTTVSTLDDDLDRALGGGIPTGYITEVTGERYAYIFQGQFYVAWANVQQ